MSKIIQIKNGQPVIAGSTVHKKIQLQVELERLKEKIDELSEILPHIPGGNGLRLIAELDALKIACAHCEIAINLIDAGE